MTIAQRHCVKQWLARILALDHGERLLQNSLSAQSLVDAEALDGAATRLAFPLQLHAASEHLRIITRACVHGGILGERKSKRVRRSCQEDEERRSEAGQLSSACPLAFSLCQQLDDAAMHAISVGVLILSPSSMRWSSCSLSASTSNVSALDGRAVS